MQDNTLDIIKSNLRAFVDRYISIDDVLYEKVINCFEFRTYKRKEIIQEAGKVADKVIFINEGFCRFFFYNKLGDEVTSDFYFAPGFITSFCSFITQQPANVSIQALVKIDVAYIKYDKLHYLYSTEHKLERLGRLIAEQIFLRTEKHLNSLLNDTPQQRYVWLIENYPDYVKYIPQIYLASYLGITPESLSRIRKRFYKSKKK